MKPADGIPRLGAEMLAVADALRNVRAQLSRLVHQSHPLVVGRDETTDILIYGPRLADALEELGQQIGLEQ